jgi:hypothetical protein
MLLGRALLIADYQKFNPADHYFLQNTTSVILFGRWSQQITEI